MSVLPAFALHRPATLDEALGLISFDNMPLCGGTELLLAMRMRVLRPESLVDVKGLAELGSIAASDGVVTIGGTVTHRSAIEHPLIAQHLPVLPGVLSRVGNPRVRASGTLAGNLAFAEPKSDVIPILTALQADLVLTSVRGVRSLPVPDFILGPYFTAREEDELITAIEIPFDGPGRPRVSRAVYLKYQTMERPTVGVAAVDIVTDGRAERRIVIGAVSDRPHTVSVPAGTPIHGHAVAEELEPIADLAGTAEYKRHVTGVYIDRAVAELDGLEPT
jgi:carbon-monoxide dehydrogenase medium subunit